MTDPAAPRHIARYSASNVESAGDGRLVSPSFERNFEPILAVLHRILPYPSGVLEIGAGTGHHAAHFAEALGPGRTWLASDPEAEHLRSTEAWRRAVGSANQRPAIELDALSDWAGRPEVRDLAPDAVYSANVIHIAPWAVSEGIVRGAGRILSPGGQLIFYGPFRVDGAHVGEGNVRFDAALRTSNPAWGVRDTGELAALAADAGFGPPELVSMPSDNRIVLFARL